MPPASRRMTSRRPDFGSHARGRTTLSILIAFLILSVVTTVISQADGPHDNIVPEADACARCHRAHSAKGSDAISAPSNNALCLTCHDGAGSSLVASTHSNAKEELPPMHFSRQEATFVLDCVTCHDPHSSQDNMCQIWDSLGGYQVVFLSEVGADSFDEDSDDDADTDDLCVTCHINPADNPGYPMEVHAGGDHSPSPAYSGDLRSTDCTSCHPHDADASPATQDGFMTCAFGGSGCHGLPPNGTSAPNREGAHSEHYTAVYGPSAKSCDVCHSAARPGDSHNDGNVTFSDGRQLPNTTVCDPCHSSDGSYDGVVEARVNWLAGDRVSCQGCHDAGNSSILGAEAPNVVGDGLSYGYFVSGHGKRDLVDCTDCHYPNGVHIDGEQRTYVAGTTDYQTSYRLDYSMDIPAPTGPGYSESRYELCFTCHKYAGTLDTVSPYNTNFRDESESINSHLRHLSAQPVKWDSDWDMTADSRISCTACHNVHGSPTPQLVRHGELISTRETSDKVPALDFRWSTAGGKITWVLTESYYGDMPPLGGTGSGSIANSKVCDGCHGGSGEIIYHRSPIEGLTDLEPPLMSNMSPAHGALDRPVDSDLFLSVSDSETGVDWNTFQIQITGDRGYAATYTDGDFENVSASGGPSLYNVTVDPESNFGYGETITVTLAVNDQAPLPNSLVPESWVFTVHEDTTAPDVSDLDPHDGAFDVPVDANVTLTLTDLETGVDWSSFAIEISGPGYLESYHAGSPEVTHTGNQTFYHVRVDPAVDMPNGDTMSVEVIVSDLAYSPNTITLDTWSFATLNEPPEAPTNTSPSDGATGIPTTPTLACSPFSDPDPSDAHQASHWQVSSTPGDYASPAYDSGTSGDLTSHTLTLELAHNVTYYWRVRHMDDHVDWSSYSAETSFTTELDET